MKMISPLSKEGLGVLQRRRCHPQPMAPPLAEEGDHFQSGCEDTLREQLG